MPYLLRNDDLIVAAFLLSFVLIVWAVSRSWAYLEEWWTGFFNEEGKRKIFTKHLDVQLNGVVPIVVSVSALMGILVTGYIQQCAPEVMAAYTPEWTFAGSVCGVLLLIVLKLLLYTLVNYTFFRSEQAGEWAKSYLVTLLLEGCLLLPLVVATVFLDLPIPLQEWGVLLLLAIVELVRLIKLKVIFFRGALGYVHIFLYFCTLNLATTIVAWQILTHIKLLLDIVK
jgi:hypothetical protein